MSPTAPSTIHAGLVISILRRYPKRWIVPAVAIIALAVLYMLVAPTTWEATQALTIRSEAINNDEHGGKFGHADEMKTTQETILELALSDNVLGSALREVGPPKKSASNWPAPNDIAGFRNQVDLSPPKGAEFGKTEIFYLKVRAADRDRAKALAAAVTEQLDLRFQELRDATAQSMVDELAKASSVARDDLNESTTQLKKFEQQVGSDLTELRVLNDAGSGESTFRRAVREIRDDLRETHILRKSNEELLTLLQDASNNPESLIATPNQLLESQPTLRQLKEGLVNAKLQTAKLEGRMSAKHPLVQAAKEAEREVIQHLHNELTNAAAAIQVDLRLNADRIAMLQEQLAEVTEKLDNLAGMRADYANLIAESETRADLLEQAEQRLSAARVSHATAKAASLIGRIDAPTAGYQPVGLNSTLILLAGLVGGLAVGIGILVMTVPTEAILGGQSHPATPEAIWPEDNGTFDKELSESNAALNSLQKASSENHWN